MSKQPVTGQEVAVPVVAEATITGDFASAAVVSEAQIAIVADAVSAGGTSTTGWADAVPTSTTASPVQASSITTQSSGLRVVNVRLVGSAALSGKAREAGAAAATVVASQGAASSASSPHPIAPVDGSLMMASQLAQQRVREESRDVREANTKVRNDAETASMYSANDHSIAPIGGDLRVATARAKQRVKDEEMLVRQANARHRAGAAMQKDVKYSHDPTEAVALVLRVQVPDAYRSGGMMPVHVPWLSSSARGLGDSDVLNVRIPETATAGSILEVQFALDMTREQRKIIEMDLTQDHGQSHHAEDAAAGAAAPAPSGSGGYQTSDYECQDYKSMYDTDSYQPVEYRSIYD